MQNENVLMGEVRTLLHTPLGLTEDPFERVETLYNLVGNMPEESGVFQYVKNFYGDPLDYPSSPLGEQFMRYYQISDVYYYVKENGLGGFPETSWQDKPESFAEAVRYYVYLFLDIGANDRYYREPVNQQFAKLRPEVLFSDLKETFEIFEEALALFRNEIICTTWLREGQYARGFLAHLKWWVRFGVSLSHGRKHLYKD